MGLVHEGVIFVRSIEQISDKPEVEQMQVDRYPLSEIHRLSKSPIKVEVLLKLVTNYPNQVDKQILSDGFLYGFKVGYGGPRLPTNCHNLISAYQNKKELEIKLLKELESDRIAGPFSCRPFKNLRLSPIGLVPKKPIGEIVRNKKWQAHQVIAIENVTLSKKDYIEIAKIVIPFSKTDQYGHGTVIEITETKLKDCPIYWLKNYLMQRPKVKGPLFCHFGGCPVTRYQFSCVLSKVLIHVGITDSVSFRTHSFRIGAASSHFEKGTSEEEIKRLGRWKSNAFKGYIR
ncbi:unnamed protein product [Mytilus edulis]|uniref:Tyr recombinase domain-containing protein n=1 Tax=Mytilus edulis TaxID=6550 RepID=A0A8S3UPX7_MYTED|nr:unnamed protein product [Mytilus edulis]